MKSAPPGGEPATGGFHGPRVISGDRRSFPQDRRRNPTPMLSRYTLFGGRRKGERRREDEVNVYVDRYEPALVGILVAIALLCALDAVFTLLYLQKGGAEANPAMDILIQNAGPSAFILVKCGITNLGLVVLCLHKNFRYVKGVIGAILLVYGMLLLYHLYLAAIVP